MTKLQKLRTAAFGIIMVITSVILARYPRDAYKYIIVFMATGLFISGVETLIYYFTMAKYMVGGKLILYRGVVLFDFALVTGALADVPRIYVLIYLAVIHLFSGLVEILRSNEARDNGGKSWRLKLFHGLVDVVVAIGCIVFARRTNTAVYMYCFGIFYSGIIRIIQSFRKTTFVYIR
ncbi:DUF308 domain-containing protein [Butyrivibrio sp. XPD2006]|uniref:DUF308 domain-containing protein n=1 Tax=Butyrivibrio sp. XPD2006 TaxID=1280668 RepID=UPI0003B2E626|nr:DUF308 domain-containing protein [Butyrivibrio sp. XPD2006]